ncbi:hypothetical protein BDN71DRAFT_1395278 [Pleurotus eryngii]|uniref:DUF2415 domain-containing protein n=1 Tax=Pleurotus eryngii TaxID=5323 RepID=A0A9P6DF78_PLEER|nr:hypothetical protein BDN71DRAFT_1395278 [Pleurotus eryngii]
MAKDLPSFPLVSPSAIVPASVCIGHVQLRDLIICPREPGVVNYVQHQSIVEHNLRAPNSPPRTVTSLNWTPNTIASIPIDDADSTLIAVGGQEAEIHISLHRKRRTLWQLERTLAGSINNSVLLTSRSNESSAEPRVGISNNDCSVKFYDVPIRAQSHSKQLKESGILRLNVPVNHSSISPDGRTLLSAGDSPKVYLHRISGGSRITLSPIHTLTLPPPDSYPLNYSSSLAASFSTAFSANGSKFAVASQEGLVAVWDVRSSKPLKVFQTDKSRMPASPGNGSASGWLSDDPWDWTRGNSKAPGWSVRSVKFGGIAGKELMIFTEHTSLIHVVDARTFETEEIIRMPTPRSSATTSTGPTAAASPQHHRSSSPQHMPRSRSPQPPMIVLALEDTFRISSSPSRPAAGSDTRWGSRTGRDSERNEEDVVVIPALGDREMEHSVQTLLGRHGIRTRQYSEDADNSRNTAYAPYRARAEEEMEVDELESDCISSHTPSRSSSPSPSTHLPIQASPGPYTLSPQNPNTSRRRQQRRLRPLTPPSGAVGLSHSSPHQQDTPMDVLNKFEYAEDRECGQDLAGTCFDPSGRYVYVASTTGVAEWSVHGAEKHWWVDDAWI